MVRPARFGFNTETAASNAFQQAPQVGAAGPDMALQRQVLAEFDGLARQLERAGVQVIVAEDSPSPIKPDAVFPNNWVSFHADGSVVLYPMLAPNRRLERRPDLLEQIRQCGHQVTRIVDLSPREGEGRFLEGTGSLVLDRVGRVAYACLSPRTDPQVLGEFGRLLGYDPVSFEAVDSRGGAIYHTNVMMAVGTAFAVVCGAAIAADAQRAAVVDRLQAGGHEVVEISLDQMNRFAGNLLELGPPSGKVIALSSGAWHALSAGQRRALERVGQPVPVDVPLIERLGGGGVRCMLAEVHLPQPTTA